MQEPLRLVATPKILQSGKIIVWNNQLYFGNSDNIPTKTSSDTVPTHTHSVDDITSGVLSTSRGGTGNANGEAPSATKLATSRTMQVNLSSTNSANFNGTSDITLGITGTLPAYYGGTGCTSLSSLKSALGISDSSPVKVVSGAVKVPGSTDYTVNLGFRPRCVILSGGANGYSVGIFVSYYDTVYKAYHSAGYSWQSGNDCSATNNITDTGFIIKKFWYKSTVSTDVGYVAIGY